MTSRLDNVIRLRDTPNGVFEGLRSSLCAGRDEIVTNGPNPEFQFIGSDPYNTNVGTGLVVPTTPSGSLAGSPRYLFLLARQSFSTGEQSYSRKGVRLVGIRQYADLVARIPAGTDPPLQTEVGPPTGSTVTFHREIKSPFWHPPDGNISWHVVVINNGQRDTRNPQNDDGLIYQDPLSPALLYQTITGTAITPTAYTAPNGGRPWGKPIGASLGNIHELRYPWRTTRAEHVLDIPIPVPCDVALYASVRQNDPALNPTLTDCAALGALSEEDQFLVVYNNYAQYGTIAGSLVFDQNTGEDVP
jgi:hypothetical protein